MRIKKALVLLLTLALVLQLVPTGFANTYDEKKIEIAAAISGMDLSDSEAVTRAQFARLLALSMTGEVYTTGSKYFQDVSQGDYAYGSISYLAGMGIVAGDGVNFHPNNLISKNEAVKMVVMALGYRQPAENKGGYFSGYLAMGTKLKLLEDCSGSADLTGMDAMMIIYNTMHANMLEMTSITQYSYTSEISDSTFLSYYRGIFKYTGTVNATAYAGISGCSATGRDAIVVGSITLENTLPIHNTYIGRKVDAYYTDNGDYEAVYISSNEQSYEIYTAEEISDNPLDHSLTNVKLEDGGNITISQYADFIFNGRLHAAIVPADLAFNDGYVEIIDNGGDSGADVVIINSIEYAKVSAVDDVSGIIYGGSGQKYNLTEAEFYTLTDETGKDIAITEVTKDDLLEVTESKDLTDKILHLKRVRKAFSGKITSLGETKTGGVLIGIGSDEYETTRAFTLTTAYAEAELGKYAIFYLNANGKIVAVKYTDESDMLYGYLLEAANEGSIGATVKMKVFTQENKCEIYDLADKVSVNYSDSKKKKQEVLTALLQEDGRAKQQMIRFSLNNDGEINKLFVADVLSEYDGISEFYGSVQATYKYSNSSKMLYVYAEKSTAYYVGDVVAYFNVLRYPIGQLSTSARLTEEDLYVSYAPHMVESGDCQAIMYDFGYTKNAKCLIVEPQNRTVVYDTNLVLVNDVKHVVDENGDDSIRIYGWKKSQKVIYEPSEYMKTSSPEMISGIKEGDIMIATFDRLEFGQLETVKKVFSKNDVWAVGHTHYNNTPVSLAYGKQTVIRGTVFDRDDAVISIDLGDGKQTIITNYLTNYYFYNTETEEYVPTAGSEIRTARESGEGSRVVIYSRYGVAYDLIILD